MDSGEGQHPVTGWVDGPVGASDLPGSDIRPPRQPHPVVEEEIPAGPAFTDQYGRERIRPCLADEPPDVKVRQDVDVVDKEVTSFQ